MKAVGSFTGIVKIGVGRELMPKLIEITRTPAISGNLVFPTVASAGK